ncbi:MAG: SAM-dependent methyltransferase [Clostridia bacterium]|nr:SAM-dependent methyltransferase [Clostridia bacterium]
MELSPRLSKIAELIPRGSIVADVGTDHAYIPVYCFINNISPKAFAMDVNKGPLERAKANLEKYGFQDRAELRLSDGLEKLQKGEADVIVIAGMGGLLIRDIIDRGCSAIDSNTQLLIQPMIAPVELRDYLFASGYDIINEYVVREENKFYNIFSVKKGEAEANDFNRYVGKNLAENSPETIDDYLEYKIRICHKIISGMKKSENPDTGAIEKHQKELDVYVKFRENIRRGS